MKKKYEISSNEDWMFTTIGKNTNGVSGLRKVVKKYQDQADKDCEGKTLKQLHNIIHGGCTYKTAYINQMKRNYNKLLDEKNKEKK